MEKIYCNECRTCTNHNSLTGEISPKKLENGDIWVQHTCQIIQCAWCESISFLDASICSEDLWTYFDEETGKDLAEIEPIISIFPMRTEAISLENIHYQLPDNLSRIYTETIKSFHQGFYILCACGLRTIMDGVCFNLGIYDGPKLDKERRRKTDLDSKIAWLSEKWFITKTQSDSLQQLRIIGNHATHTVERPTTSELTLAINMIQDVLKLIYILPDKTDELIRIRKRAWKKVYTKEVL